MKRLLPILLFLLTGNWAFSQCDDFVVDNIWTTDNSCFQLCDGSATVVASGGAEPYIYQIDGMTQQGSTFTDLCAGTYIVNVVDQNGCQTSDGFTINEPSMISTVTGAQNATNGSNGMAWCGTTSGGTPPYSQQWDDPLNTTNDTLYDAASGTYTVIVTDANGCMIQQTVTIEDETPMSLTFVAISDTCSSYLGEATVTVSGGTAPYTYQWNDPASQTTQTCYQMIAGVYSVTVTDADGHVITGNVTINNVGPEVSISDQTICSGQTTQLETMVSGGTPPYSYLWSTGEVTPVISGVSTGTYTCVVTDNNGCEVEALGQVIETNITIVCGMNQITMDCNNPDCDFTATPVVTGGDAPYTYLWNDGSTSYFHSDLCVGTYEVTITDNNGCSGSIEVLVDYNNTSDSCAFVWPGDTDNDGEVNNEDILPIGLAYGEQGEARFDQSISWEEHAAKHWLSAIDGGSDKVYVDSDGSGLINEEDTLAIIQNYGQTHAKVMKAAQQNDVKITFSSSNTNLGTDENGVIQVNLGDQDTPAENIYGLVFTINYDTSLVQDSTVAFSGVGSWLNGEGDLIDITYNRTVQGQLDVGIVKTNKSAISGFGQIGELSYITIDNLAGKALLADTTTFSFSNVYAITVLNEEIAINSGDTIAVEITGTVNLSTNTQQELIIAPNPAATFVKVLNAEEGAMYELFDLSGKLIEKGWIINDVIDLNAISKGLYMLKVTSDNNVSTARISVE